MVWVICLGKRTLPHYIGDEARANEKREGVEKFVHHRISNIRMRCPDISLRKKRANIGPPCISRPSQHLLKEPPIRFHSTKQLGLLADLHVGIPAVADHPPC